MKRKLTLSIFLIICGLCHMGVFAQSTAYAEHIVKYNLKQHRLSDGAKIPFDKPFAIIVEGLDAKGIYDIQAFQVDWINGKRRKKLTAHKDTLGNTVKSAIVDMKLGYGLSYVKEPGPLQINIEPLRPNTYFDLQIIYHLPDSNRVILDKVNRILAKKDKTFEDDAKKIYEQLLESLIDPYSNSTYASWDFYDYQNYFNDKLYPIYHNNSTLTGYLYQGTVSSADIQAMAALAAKDTKLFEGFSALMSIVKDSQLTELADGRLNVAKLKSSKAMADVNDFFNRQKNLEAAIEYTDQLLKTLDELSALAIRNGASGTNITTTDALRVELLKLLKNSLKPNLEKVKVVNTAVISLTDNIRELKATRYLGEGNYAADIKTKGASLLFLDAGLTNILARGMDRKTVYIPRLYLGVSIYFRPIDKNTRTTKLVTKSELDKTYQRDIWIKDCGYENGPDYGIAARRSIWQHLSLNIGFTMGSLPNTDFDNFYNNMSLLIGPAYRFRGPFKVSTGLSLLKRSSFNPLLSEKRVVAGIYASVSVDIDFLEGIKDVKNLLFK